MAKATAKAAKKKTATKRTAAKTPAAAKKSTEPPIDPADLAAAAAYLDATVRKHGELEQEDAAMHLVRWKGCTYYNDNLNLAIDRRVLSAFPKLTEGEVVWERSERKWRLKVKGWDGEGRQAE